jgi:TetR/AcrR family transcriptional regulator, ethionamide resistance regulator
MARTVTPPRRAEARSRARRSRGETRKRIGAAATELVRDRSYPELTVGAVMERAGLERTLFYRHFDDLGDLLMQVSREAMEELFEAELDLGADRDAAEPGAIRAAIEPAVAVYRRHGPLLRALAEAAAGDEQIAAGQERIRARFDELVARSLAELAEPGPSGSEDLSEIARALNRMNESYLLDVFGGEPLGSADTAARTLTEVWVAVINRGVR